MELNRCTNFHVASSKYLEIRGLPACTCVARAQCTTTPLVMRHRTALVELYQCTKFRVASSKFPESKGAYACAKCTCIARALCTLSPNDSYHRIAVIEPYRVDRNGHRTIFAGNRRCALNHQEIFTALKENASKLMW